MEHTAHGTLDIMYSFPDTSVPSALETLAAIVLYNVYHTIQHSTAQHSTAQHVKKDNKMLVLCVEVRMSHFFYEFGMRYVELECGMKCVEC